MMPLQVNIALEPGTAFTRAPPSPRPPVLQTLWKLSKSWKSWKSSRYKSILRWSQELPSQEPHPAPGPPSCRPHGSYGSHGSHVATSQHCVGAGDYLHKKEYPRPPVQLSLCSQSSRVPRVELNTSVILRSSPKETVIPNPNYHGDTHGICLVWINQLYLCYKRSSTKRLYKTVFQKTFTKFFTKPFTVHFISIITNFGLVKG